MEDPVHQSLPVKNELAGENGHAGILSREGLAQVDHRSGYVGCRLHPVVGRESMAPGHLHVLLQPMLRRVAQGLHFRCALERPGVDLRYGNENEVLVECRGNSERSKEGCEVRSC